MEGRTRYGAQQLTRKVLDMVSRKRREIVLLEKVVDAHPEEFGDEADVVPVVEPAQEMYAFTTTPHHQHPP